MKPSILPGVATLLLSLACSSGSESDGNGGAAGSGATSSNGATGSTGPGGNVGSGAGPVLTPETLGGSGNGGGGGSSPVDNGECAQQSVVVGVKPADVLLVLDRSKSMIENTVPPNDATRWDAVVPALASVLTETDATVSWGLKLFPEGEGKECIEASVTDAIPVPIAPKNAAAVNAAITATMALGNGTPTGAAIRAASAYLKERAVDNQYILLATDGEPSCPDDEATEEAVAAISEAKAAGFPVYVVGVVNPTKDKGKFKTLNAMAEAGGTARDDAETTDKFYQAYSQDALTAALQAVTGKVVSCVLDLTSKPPVPSNIAVSVDGEWLQQDTTRAQGWDYTSDQYVALELHGDACQRLKTGRDTKVDIIYGCAGKPIDIPK
jgi:hypothetical protein